MDIIEAIQKEVDRIVKEKYNQDIESPPRFFVSQYEKRDNEGNIINHEILLTVMHCGFVISRTIFPRLEYSYGYETLEDEIMWLYNTTV